MSKKIGNLKIGEVEYYPRPSFHIGAVIISMEKFNPSEEYGGVWELFGQGRTLIGVDLTDADYNASGKTGGEKSHRLTEGEMPSHSHYCDFKSSKNWNSGNMYGAYFPAVGTPLSWSDAGSQIQSTGGNQAHNNLPPYITVYFYRRVS